MAVAAIVRADGASVLCVIVPDFMLRWSGTRIGASDGHYLLGTRISFSLPTMLEST
jgi:hypothetical protein